MTKNSLLVPSDTSEIVLYQPNQEIRLEVRLDEETVWLTQAQMAILFKTTPQNVTLHIRNIYKEGELEADATCKDYLQVREEGRRTVQRIQKFYNLDVIISVGYRVKSIHGTRFRQWANSVLKDYLLRGYAINQRFERLEQRVAKTEEKIDFFVRTSLPPVEGIFFEGQIFDAYQFVEGLIKEARQRIILIDNYINAQVFNLLEQRPQDVAATIYTERITSALQHTQQLSASQHGRTIDLRAYSSRFHDRFLIIDSTIYHFGASFKDLGRRLFAFTRMEASPEVIMSQL